MLKYINCDQGKDWTVSRDLLASTQLLCSYREGCTSIVPWKLATFSERGCSRFCVVVRVRWNSSGQGGKIATEVIQSARWFFDVLVKEVGEQLVGSSQGASNASWYTVEPQWRRDRRRKPYEKINGRFSIEQYYASSRVVQGENWWLSVSLNKKEERGQFLPRSPQFSVDQDDLCKSVCIDPSSVLPRWWSFWWYTRTFCL